MRKLQATDLFAMARVVNAIGIKEEIKKIAMNANSVEELEKGKEEIGFELLFAIFEKATQRKAEKELFEFLAGIFEMAVAEVQQLEPTAFINKVLEAADVESWKAFFSQLAKLTK